MLHVELAEVEELIDQIQQLKSITTNDLQQFPFIVILVLIQKIFHRRNDQRKRRTELMTDVCEETQLHLVHLMLLLRMQTLFSIMQLLLCLGQYAPAPIPSHADNENRIKHDCPDRTPERRFDMDDKHGRIGTGKSIVVDSTHRKGICSGTEIRIGNLACIRIGFKPAIVESFKTIVIFNLIRHTIVECSKRQTDVVIRIRQCQFSGIGNAMLENRMFIAVIGMNLLGVDLHSGNDHLRIVIVHIPADLRRLEQV